MKNTLHLNNVLYLHFQKARYLDLDLREMALEIYCDAYTIDFVLDYPAHMEGQHEEYQVCTVICGRMHRMATLHSSKISAVFALSPMWRQTVFDHSQLVTVLLNFCKDLPELTDAARRESVCKGSK